MSEHRTAWSLFTSRDLKMTAEAFLDSVGHHVEYSQGKDDHSVTARDLLHAVSHSARDRIVDRWNRTQRSYYHADVKRVYYLSLEFLLGRLLGDTLLNLGIRDEAKEALGRVGLDLDTLSELEPDAGLGNGGLGRLAACYLDSMATLGIAGMGYGIRYDYGIFRQVIQDGGQIEAPDAWLRYGNPWEFLRQERTFRVRFGGTVRTETRDDGSLKVDWVDTDDVLAVPYDIPVPGYENPTCNTLRLWAARSNCEFRLDDFNRGDYVASVHDRDATEAISRVLYPSDNQAHGRELRLQQEYFFVSATLQDALFRHLKTHPNIRNLHEKAVFQLNDTHPSIAVAELMRLLMDEHLLGWDDAWDITSNCIAFTNHTLMPEALEEWPVYLFERLLPRHLEIIYEINRRFLYEVCTRCPGDEALVQKLSLIREEPERRVRMAHLAIVGSFAVNGVSELHSRILRERVFPELSSFFPDRFRNVTNGITPRRWLRGCNHELSGLITSVIGDGWACDLSKLEDLVPFAEDASFREAWRAVRRHNRERLCRLVQSENGIALDPDVMVDSQVKRIHEYKRQLLNILRILSRALDLLDTPAARIVPRSYVFAGKAAPSYTQAKLIIRLVHAVADFISSQPSLREQMRVVFLADYRVSLAETIIPATDLSEQISTAGTEASGTGNMKFMLNGGVTIGTLDGANIEIQEAVGDASFFSFGHTAEQVQEMRSSWYRPRDWYMSDAAIGRTLDAVASGILSPADPHRFGDLVDALLRADPFFVLADFRSYVEAQGRVDDAFLDEVGWTRKSILNTAKAGRFSSDRSIREYAERIWHVKPRSQPCPGSS
jgi:glycogen phosphorylase